MFFFPKNNFLLGQHLSYPACQDVRMERHIMTNMTDGQLELGFNGLQTPARIKRREGRIARANWWFAKMRAAVEGAMDWQTARTPRPEQIWMPGANRQMKI
jgi:hypothetical protein